ncbi:MAG TPA: hypothetical protein VJ969_06320 [Desulfopila sp.]|nr:hypothetical protein [Desulfopila sp.]
MMDMSVFIFRVSRYGLLSFVAAGFEHSHVEPVRGLFVLQTISTREIFRRDLLNAGSTGVMICPSPADKRVCGLGLPTVPVKNTGRFLPSCARSEQETLSST